MVGNGTFGANNLQVCLQLVGHNLWLLEHVPHWSQIDVVNYAQVIFPNPELHVESLTAWVFPLFLCGCLVVGVWTGLLCCLISAFPPKVDPCLNIIRYTNNLSIAAKAAVTAWPRGLEYHFSKQHQRQPSVLHVLSLWNRVCDMVSNIAMATRGHFSRQLST